MLYFVETPAGTATKAVIKDAGLAYAFDGPVTSVRVNQGPSGKPGLVMWNATLDHKGYDPANQRWRNIPGSTAMVGMDARVELRPESLKRPTILAGVLVPLADDQLWEIPIARKRIIEDDSIFFQHRLPRAQSVNEAGEWEMGEALPKYRALWDLAEDYSNSSYNLPPREGAKDLDMWNHLLGAAVEVLAANYRVGAAEVSLLGLFSREHAKKVLDVFIDAETLNNWLKKKAEEAPAGVNS